MTEELLQKKAIKSQRRREVAAQKREKEKVVTSWLFLGSIGIKPYCLVRNIVETHYRPVAFEEGEQKQQSRFWERQRFHE